MRHPKHALLPALLLAMVGGACASVSVHAPMRTADMRYEINKNATVMVRTAAGKTGGLGTGVVVDDRLIMTNHHVVESVHGHKDGRLVSSILEVCTVEDDILTCYKGEVVAADERYDIAFVRVNADLPAPVEFGDDAILAEGEPVHARLSVLNILPPTLVHGRYMDRTRTPYTTGPQMLILDMSANPGGSGGPLFDKDGRLIGIVRAVTTSPGRSNAVAIPVSSIKAYLERLAIMRKK